MLLIKDENTLRTFLPNAFASVEGEVSLFDKLQPWLQIGELWLQQKVLGAATMHAISEEASSPLGGTGGGLYCLSCKIVVSTAFRRAIPSLDLVLPPNGFGIDVLAMDTWRALTELDAQAREYDEMKRNSK